ncbi:MAG: peptidase C45 [Candidatus Eremiobacteraeota bacterium]|nr:peptidase C45 [Candidatus Eremiobacteraeota bacterium]
MKKYKIQLFCLLISVAVIICLAVQLTGCATNEARCTDLTTEMLEGASREDLNGWVFLHIEGEPRTRGFQHGYLLSSEIDDFISVLKVYLKQTTKEDWSFYRETSENIFLPKIEKEYLDEMEGIAAGLQAQGFDYDVIDIIASNSFFEVSDYYLPTLPGKSQKNTTGRKRPRLRCSAFIATGSWTKDGNVVVGHNSWDDYIIGQRFNLILDIKPTSGNRLMIQSAPGFIHSGTDFGVNSAGIVYTETTIGNFKGFDVNGIPEFVRSRKAAQYSNTIDDFVKIMSEGNNGGYANTWLMGDINTGEIGRLELGLINIAFSRSKEGYYDGENYVDNSKMIREECGPSFWDTEGSWPDNLANTNCVTARRLRWNALMAQYKGKIDAELSEQFEADQYEQALGMINPGGFVLMARMEITDIPEIPGADAPRPFGANEAKAIDATLAKNMSFRARMGHPDGSEFTWDEFLEENSKFAWQKPYLKNLVSNPWTLFTSKN